MLRHSSQDAFAQAQSSTLLVLAKSDNTVAIVDPATLQVLARIPAGPDPHEIVASDDGKLAFISNYGGSDSALNTISVVDLVARKALPPIDLGAVRSTHGLDFAGGKLYFTAETNKVIGRYDPATQRVDWILGTGQDRTHMIAVSKSSRPHRDFKRQLRHDQHHRTSFAAEWRLRSTTRRWARRTSSRRAAARARWASGRTASHLGSNERCGRSRRRRLRHFSRWKRNLGC